MVLPAERLKSVGQVVSSPVVHVVDQKKLFKTPLHSMFLPSVVLKLLS